MAGIDTFTKLMLHMDGANLGTVFTDDEPAPTKSVTASGGAITSTTAPKFGTASGLFVIATSSYLTVGTATDFKFLHAVGASGTWTIDFWLKPSAFVATQRLFDTGGQASGTVGLEFELQTDGTIFIAITTGSVGNLVLAGTLTGVVPNDAAWHHLAITYDQSKANQNCTQFIDGVLTATLDKTAVTPSSADQAYAALIAAGAAVPASFYGGNLDEFRISNVVRWTNNFSPPSAPYSSGSGGGNVMSYYWTGQ